MQPLAARKQQKHYRARGAAEVYPALRPADGREVRQKHAVRAEPEVTCLREERAVRPEGAEFRHESTTFRMIVSYKRFEGTTSSLKSSLPITLNDSFGRALSCAGTALKALVLIDNIVQIAHIDSFGRALSCAGNRSDRHLVGNNKKP